MTFFDIFILALALSADAFSVGTAVGLKHRSGRQRFRLSFHFGLFQSLLSGGGAIAGVLILRWIEGWDHWLIFGLLAAVGLKMIKESFDDEDKARASADLTRGAVLVGLSIAVSLDALAAGVGLAVARAPIVLAVTVIGIVSGLATLAAMLAAPRVGAVLGKRCELLAGLVLIGLGLKTLLEHMGYL